MADQSTKTIEIDGVERQLPYTLQSGEAGTDALRAKVVASDGTTTGNTAYSPYYDVAAVGPGLNANAGANQAVTERSTVTMSASATSGTAPYTFAWSVQDAGGTTLASGELSGATTDTLTFTAPDVGTAGDSVVILLTVTDGDGNTATDTATINVSDRMLVAPTNFTATPVPGSRIDLGWSASANAGQYVVEWSADGSTNWQPVGSTASTNLSDTGLAGSTRYYYRLRSTETGYTPSAYVYADTTTLAGAAVPAGVTEIDAYPVGPEEARTTWTYDDNDQTGFYVQRRLTSVGGAWANAATVGPAIRSALVSGLTAETEYDIRVVPYNIEGLGTPSAVDVIETTIEGAPFDAQVAESDPGTNYYLASPGQLRLSNGDWICSHDSFGTGAPRDVHGSWDETKFYRSTDDRKTWTLEHTFRGNVYWPTLFLDPTDPDSGTIYMVGTSAWMGGLAIMKSTDSGVTWGNAVLLFAGGNGTTPPNYHTAPTGFLVHDGHIIFQFENRVNMSQFVGSHANLLIYAPTEDDLMDPSNWTKTTELVWNAGWIPAELQGSPGFGNAGPLEGNVRLVNGSIKIISRLYALDWDHACVFSVTGTPSGKNLTIQPSPSIVYMPGGENSKFTIRYDDVSQLWIGFVNPQSFGGFKADQRNMLWMVASTDPTQDYNWIKVAETIPFDRGHSTENYDVLQAIEQVGFQYTEWEFLGEDIPLIIRASWGGPSFGASDNNHDSNRIVSKVVTNFRQYLTGINDTTTDRTEVMTAVFDGANRELNATGTRLIGTHDQGVFGLSPHNASNRSTWASNPTWTSESGGTAVFNGVDQYLQIGRNVELNPVGGIAWFWVGTFYHDSGDRMMEKGSGLEDGSQFYATKQGLSVGGRYAAYGDVAGFLNTKIVLSSIYLPSQGNGAIYNYVNGDRRIAPTATVGGTYNNSTHALEFSAAMGAVQNLDPTQIGRREGSTTLFAEMQLQGLYVRRFSSVAEHEAFISQLMTDHNI